MTSMNRNNLYNALELMRKRYTVSTEEYFSKLKEYGIELSEEKIIEDYEKVRDIETLEQKYYDQYGKILDDKQEEKWLNSDVFIELLERIIPDHFKVEDTGDPYFITSAINEICSQELRKVSQDEIEKVLKALVTLSKTRDCHSLNSTLEMLNLDGLLKELVKVCHNRNTAFRALIRELYECYEDMDPKIFPSVYKEYSKH